MTKATRAAEYWASEADEYALPDKVPNGSGNPRHGAQGFTSGRVERDRLSKPYKRDKMGNIQRSPPKPVIRLPQRDHHFPEMPTFQLGQVEAAKPETDLGMFTNASSSGLALMKSLGLPGEDSSPLLSPSLSAYSGGSPNWSGGATLPSRGAMPSRPPAWVPKMPHFSSTAKAAMDDWKSLGLPSANGAATTASAGAAVTARSGAIPLAQGTKRLGMGRPAPWRSKR